jgi:hypothetical protein
LSQGLAPSVEEATGKLKSKEKPPYRTPSWYEKFFGIIQSRKLDSITLDFIRMNIASGKDEYKFYSGLKFLGLINDDGSVTEQFGGLRLTGDQFSKNLEQTIREAYKEVFDSVVLESARAENMVNFFIEKYGFSRNTAEGAVKMLSYFASKTNIPISSELSTFSGSGKSKFSEVRIFQRAKPLEPGMMKDQPRRQGRGRAYQVQTSASVPSIQATINITLDKDTPIEIWDKVLRLLKGPEEEQEEPEIEAEHPALIPPPSTPVTGDDK